MSEEVRKLQTHLNLLREEYVKLQRRLNDVEKQYQLATAGSSSGDGADGFVSRLLKIVSDLYGKELYSDLVIKLNGREMRGHKFVLAARSDFWGVPDLSQVDSLDLSDLAADVGLALLRWIYTDQSEVIHSADDSFVLLLLKAAKKYKLDPLASRCEQALIVSVTVKNCIKYYQTAEEISAASLLSHCSQLISSHWNDFTSDDFATMPASLAYKMFKSKTAFPLHAAIRARREDVVFLYLVDHDLELPGKLNEVDNNDDLPLDIALRICLEGVAQTLVKYHVDVNMSDRSGWRLLHKAIKRGDEYAARFLIENGADVNVVLPTNRQTPLHLAALYKSSFSAADSDGADSIAKVTQLLLQRGANTNAQDSDSRTALHYAVTTENLAVFNVLLADGSSNLELPDSDGSTALWLALNKSSVDVSDNVYAAKLVSCGGSTNAVITKSGDTMLHLAAQSCNESAGLFLLNHGANSNATNHKGETVLHIACHNGLVKLVRAALDASSNANAQTLAPFDENSSTYRQTPLHLAVIAGHKDVVRALLDFKVQVTHSGHSLQVIPNLTLKDSEGQSALGLALVLKDRLDIAELLLTGGANVNDSDSEGKTLLYQAIERHDVDSAVFLLKHQADPDACTASGSDCLHAAVSNNLPKVVDILCQKGAQIDRCDCTGESALWLALSAEQSDIADILVRHGCDINMWHAGPGGCQQTLLHRAIDENKQDVACFLIRRKCDVNSSRRPGPNGEGDEEARDKQSPLHLSAAWGLEQIVQCLIEHNADVNAKDVDGKAPLHIAIENQHFAIISLLLSHPALNLNTRDRFGLTPFAAAMSTKNNKAAQAILDREPTAAEQFDVKGRNFLHTAIQKADLEAVLFLLSIHVDVNSRLRDSSQLTPLHLAVISGHEMIARNLLLAGVNVNDTTPQKQTALHLAAAHDRSVIAVILLDSGINPDAVDDNFNNALHVAVQHGHLNTVKTLLKHSNINAEAINIKGQNVLHILGQCGKENAAAIFDFLIDCRPNLPIDQLDSNGNTVLLLAYFNGNGSLCRAVVKAGAQLGTVNRDGLSIFNAPVATKQLLFKLLDMLVKEPVWFEGETCLECSVRFGIKTRKHHCRHCGRILCAKCSEKDIPIIKYNITKPVRVCDMCFDVLTLGS